MKLSRFLFVIGMGRGPMAHPVWPDVHQQFLGEPDRDGTWVAWRLTGANHRELGRSARVFADLELARADALAVRERVAQMHAHIVTIPNTGLWGWRMSLDEEPVATSSRGYARHRECTYNVTAFAAAAAAAEVTDAEPPYSWQLLDRRAVGPAL